MHGNRPKHSARPPGDHGEAIADADQAGEVAGGEDAVHAGAVLVRRCAEAVGRRDARQDVARAHRLAEIDERLDQPFASR